jgi:hypothetical protein
MGEPVWGIASTGDTVWVEADDGLHQLDGRSGEELGSMPGFIPTVVGDTLWYQRDDELVEADAQTGEERNVYHPPILGGTIVDDGIYWAASEEEGVLAKIDLKRNKVLARLRLPEGEPKWVEPWEGTIWVVIDGEDVVVRVDPRTATVLDTVDAGSRPHSVATGFGSLWITEHASEEVLRFDPDGHRTAAIFPGVGINVAITVGNGYVWAATPDGVARIDPATNRVVEQIVLGSGDWYGLAASKGNLWLTSAEGGVLYQIPMQ